MSTFTFDITAEARADLVPLGIDRDVWARAVDAVRSAHTSGSPACVFDICVNGIWTKARAEHTSTHFEVEHYTVTYEVEGD